MTRILKAVFTACKYSILLLLFMLLTLAACQTAQPQTLYILMYHEVIQGKAEDCGPWTTTTDRFREDLAWLRDNGYTFYLPGELAGGAPLADKAVMLTFDDGYASGRTLVMPLLEEFGAKAVISPIVRRVEDEKPGFLSWDMCREMADSGLFEFGSHTYDNHQGENPPGITRKEGESRSEYETRVFADLDKSVALLEEHLGQKVRFFAYPHGDTEEWASDYLREHFAMTVTTRHGPADLSGGLYDLPRHNINAQNQPGEYLP